MNNNYRLYAQAKFIVGRGSLSHLGRLGARRAAVIHGGRSLPEERKARIAALIEEGGGECRFVAQILREPFFEDIEAALAAVREYQPDLFIAVGGGAVIDTAKGIHLFYEYPELSREAALMPYSLPELGAKARMVAVPTTSGTGAETTSAAVFTDRETERKHLLLADTLIPHYAILDADLTDSLPPTIAAHTGMDALTHAMEASVSVAASSMVRSNAVAASLDLLENLEVSADPAAALEERQAAREICHTAASLAGVAITNSCAGLAHGFDQPGPRFGLPHGQVCGILLPYTTAFTGVQPAYLTLARRLGLRGADDRSLCQALVDHITGFNERLGLPRGFAAAGVDEKDFFAQVDDFAALAAEAVATKLSPRVPTRDEAVRLFTDAFYGNPPLLT